MIIHNEYQLTFMIIHNEYQLAFMIMHNEYQLAFMIIHRRFLLRKRNVSGKSCRENQNTHFVFNNFFFRKILPFMRYLLIYLLTYLLTQRHLWSRGSVLAFGTQVRGFKPGRSRRIIQGEENLQHASLRKGSKAVCPMLQICGM